MTSGFIKVGGYSGLQDKYMMAIPNSSIPNTTCGIPREDSFVLLRNAVDSDIPWPGFVLGVTASSIWYWCADQVHSDFVIFHCNLHGRIWLQKVFSTRYIFFSLLWSFLLWKAQTCFYLTQIFNRRSPEEIMTFRIMTERLLFY